MSYSALSDQSFLAEDGVVVTLSHDGDVTLTVEDEVFSAEVALSDEVVLRIAEWLAEYVSATRSGEES